ncbi:MAG TPA: hypothetical protein VGT98_07855 [Candidatus Elarobacter sp.]|nr:hypothetical protein [Candidatus Elarobacter sp.]
MTTRGEPRTRAAVSFANQVYGLLVVGAALAIARPGAQSRWSVFLDVLAGAAVYCLAHIYAEVLEQRVEHGRALDAAEKRAIALDGLVIVRATALPFGALVVCWLFRVSVATSVTTALWVLVGELAVTSYLSTAAVGSRLRRLSYAAGATAMGLALIVLKIVTH